MPVVFIHIIGIVP